MLLESELKMDWITLYVPGENYNFPRICKRTDNDPRIRYSSEEVENRIKKLIGMDISGFNEVQCWRTVPILAKGIDKLEGRRLDGTLNYLDAEVCDLLRTMRVWVSCYDKRCCWKVS